MTDKIKKLEPLNEDVQPEFPSTARGGYIEDVVDDWLRTHLKEVNEIIKYQNYGVDVVDGLESDLATAQERIQTLEAAPATVVEGDSSAEVETLRAELSEAKSLIQSLEANVQRLKDNAPLDAFPNMESETVQASLLLQQATRLGAEYIENAKSDGEQIRRDAEDRLVEVRGEIEGLEAQRFATFRTLEDFFSTELSKLRENAVFISEEDDVAGEKDVPASEVPADVPDEDELEEEIKVAEAEGLPVKMADEAENNAETKSSAK